MIFWALSSTDLQMAAETEWPPTKREASLRVKRLPCIKLVTDLRRARPTIVLCHSDIVNSVQRTGSASRVFD